MNRIHGHEALEIMRNLKAVPGASFKMVHLLYNTKSQKHGARLVNRCRVRAALPDDVFETDSELYLPYLDLDEEHQARMCFRVLIRRVAFPPEYEWMKVVWVDE